MLLEHRGQRPRIHPSAYIAPTATVCGDVTIGPECRVLFGAVLTAEGGPITVGGHCIIMENASGASVFNGARIGAGAEVRINGIVHLLTVVPPDATVPIGWIAVGDPAAILPPDQHEEIWALQGPLNFPRTVFGLERPPEGESLLPELTRRYARALNRHRDDRIVEDGAGLPDESGDR
jgi:carbonic anhydrase/acetyltransferase-like protein (isoleucine patch superfamily)